MEPENVTAKFEVRSFTRSWHNMGHLKTLGSRWIRRSRSSKVVDFGTKRKRVCDFLFVRHSNLAPIVHRLGDIARYLCSWVTPPLFHPNFGVFPLYQVAHVLVSPSRTPRLFGREINFEAFQPMWSRYLNVTDRQTDGHTEGQTTYCGITALCVASRGKNDRNFFSDAKTFFGHFLLPSASWVLLLCASVVCSLFQFIYWSLHVVCNVVRVWCVVPVCFCLFTRLFTRMGWAKT